jgi:class 3 adenylate cyclase
VPVSTAPDMCQNTDTVRAEPRRMRFRIGIDLGDIIHDASRIYGDGINVGARLESIAEPGGICLSRQVFDQVHSAAKAEFRRLGPRSFKNIAQPVEVFALSPSDLGARAAAGIPGARFVPFQGRNHLFLETEPAFGQFLEHTRAFPAG